MLRLVKKKLKAVLIEFFEIRQREIVFDSGGLFDEAGLSLRNLRLREGVLDPLRLPLKLATNLVGSLAIHGLDSLAARSRRGGLAVVVSDVSLVMTVDHGEGRDVSPEAIQQAKQKLVQLMETFGGAFSWEFLEGFFKEALTRPSSAASSAHGAADKKPGVAQKTAASFARWLFSNLSLEFDRIHLRIETRSKETGSDHLVDAVGLLLPSIRIQPMDDGTSAAAAEGGVADGTGGGEVDSSMFSKSSQKASAPGPAPASAPPSTGLNVEGGGSGSGKQQGRKLKLLSCSGMQVYVDYGKASYAVGANTWTPAQAADAFLKLWGEDVHTGFVLPVDAAALLTFQEFQLEKVETKVG